MKFNLLLILFVVLQASQSFPKEKTVDAQCFLNKFDEKNFPWPLADCLNFEEVFKNFQYSQVNWDEDSSVLTVKTYENGKEILIKKYQYKNAKLVLIN